MDFTNFFFGKKAEEPKHEIGQSLRFRGNQSLHRTFSGTGDTFTISFWTKITTPDSNLAYLFSAGTNSPSLLKGQVTASGKLYNPTLSSTVTTDANRFRDPNAWYHIMYVSDAGIESIYVNGELVSVPNAGTGNFDGQFAIGELFSLDYPDAYFNGYMANWYLIDGKVLPPTVFGNYDENDVWTPRDPGFEVNTQKYSAFLYGTDNQTYGEDSNQKLFLGGYPPAQLFDGNIDTGCNFGTGANGGNWGYYKPSTPIKDAAQIRLRLRQVQAVRIDGVDQGIVGVDGTTDWRSLTSLPSEINEIAIQGTTSFTPQWNAIEVDGEILVDGPLYSGTAGDALFYDPQDPADGTAEQAVDWSTTNPLGQGETNLFDGNLASAVGPSPGSAVNGCIIWKNPVPVTVNQGIRVYIGAGGSGSQRFYINEEYSGQFSMASPGWVNVSSPNLTPPYTLESMGFKGYSGNYSGFAAAIEVDGVILQNGVGMDYGASGFHLDFSDPNDVGADRSGNGNNFTATGFNTDPVGVFSDGLFSSPNPLNPNSTATNVSANRTDSFDGNNLTAANATIQDEWLVFRPSTPFNDVADIVVHASNTSEVAVNGNTEWTGNVVSAVDIPVYSGAPITVTSISVKPTAGGFGNVNSYTINGRVLVDNTGTDYDLMQDSPTQNFATLNPLVPGASNFSNGNLSATANGSNSANRGTPNSTFKMPSSGKYYAEFTPTSIGEITVGLTQEGNGNTVINYYHLGSITLVSGTVGTGSSYTTGDVIGVAVDVDNTTVRFYKNGTAQLSSATDYSSAPDSDNCYLTFKQGSSTGSCTATANYGQQPFIHTPPAGFEALQTQNLPESTIPNGRDHFQAITGSGTGANTTDPDAILGAFSSTWSASGDGFASKPPANAFDDDTTNWCNNNTGGQTITWDTSSFNLVGELTVRMRESGAYTMSIDGVEVISAITDSSTPSDYTVTVNNPQSIVWAPVPSVGSGIYLYNFQLDGNNLRDGSILALAQQTFPNGVWWIKDRVNSNNHQLLDSVRGGNFVLQPNTAASETSYVPPSGDSVAWCWKAGDTIETDNTGTAESQVYVNHDAGFSIVQWVGTGAFDSIGHGLGKRPGMVITRTRQADHWIVGVDGVTTLSGGGTPSQWISSESFVGTNWANAVLLNSSNAATNYVASSGINISGNNMMAYVWTPIEGFSSFGTFAGNGDENGPFIYTGFKPAYVLIKSTNQAQSWIIYDSVQSPHNPVDDYIYANNTAGTATGRDCDFLSNGFKIRTTGSVTNFSGYAYLYAAFAENPFQSPVTAR